MARLNPDHLSNNESSESVTERINAVLRIASNQDADDEANVRPKRKAAKSPIIEDLLDDSDEDAHYKESASEDSDTASSDNNNDVAPTVPVKSSRRCLIVKSDKFRTIYQVAKVADMFMWNTRPQHPSESYARVSGHKGMRG